MYGYENEMNSSSFHIKDAPGNIKSLNMDVLSPRECKRNAAMITDRNMAIRPSADIVKADSITFQDVKDSDILRIVLKMLQKF